MFNPFDGLIMKKFIENNYNNLVKNKSVIAYSNYNQLDIIKSYTKNIETIDQYKLAICYF
jgi:ABC-type molybdate transport system substrate-binding protein